MNGLEFADAAAADAADFAHAADVGMAPERLGWARRLMRRQVELGRSPSVAAVVARRGRVVMAEAYGVQRPDGDPLTVDHVWPIASCGKPLTAAVLLTLVEEGLVGLTDTAVDYLPELDGPGDGDVLVHHLLTHTAGWESALRTHRLERVLADGSLPPCPEGRDLVTHLMLSLAFDPIRTALPGRRMEYDNSHYELLAEIVRRITGGTLDAAVRERILDPLGLTRSAVIVPESLRPELVQRAPGLPFGPGGPMVFEGETWESSDSGSVGMLMSPGDLAVFGQMLLEGGALGDARVLAPSTVVSMMTDQVPGTPALFAGSVLPQASWGYGFTVLHEHRFPYFAGGLLPPGSVLHPGAGGIAFWIDPVHEIVGVYFEVVTKMTEFLEPVSSVCHRFQDVITGAVER